ncbi:hypothetical protein [Candidatus Nitrospira bockiana]
MEPDVPPSTGPSPVPNRQELLDELLPFPEPPEQPPLPDPPGTDKVIAEALGYIRGRRGADLVSVILVGSGIRRALTPHSDLNFIALVKGQDEGEEVVRVADRQVDIRYRSHKAVEQELPFTPRLPPLLRKGRILFDYEQIGARLVEKAAQRFRQGPRPASMNEKIRLKADCLHRLGKAEDVVQHPATAQYLLTIFFDHLLQAYFRLKGYWVTAPAEMLKFIGTRDPALGELFEKFLTAPSLPERLALARELADVVLKDIPLPQRID